MKLYVLDTTIDIPNNYKTLNCFDVSANDLLLCGGTDVYGGDAFILFWDVRNVKLMGAYWESHTDDVTQVRCCIDWVKFGGYNG